MLPGQCLNELNIDLASGNFSILMIFIFFFLYFPVFRCNIDRWPQMLHMTMSNQLDLGCFWHLLSGRYLSRFNFLWRLICRNLMEFYNFFLVELNLGDISPTYHIHFKKTFKLMLTENKAFTLSVIVACLSYVSMWLHICGMMLIIGLITGCSGILLFKGTR